MPLTEVPTIKIDTVVDRLELTRVSHLFIEVNGVEAAVIDGAAALLRRDCPMVIAADRYMGEGRSELKDKLHTVFGYKQFKTLNGELFAEKCK